MVDADVAARRAKARKDRYREMASAARRGRQPPVDTSCRGVLIACPRRAERAAGGEALILLGEVIAELYPDLEPGSDAEGEGEEPNPNPKKSVEDEYAAELAALRAPAALRLRACFDIPCMVFVELVDARMDPAAVCEHIVLQLVAEQHRSLYPRAKRMEVKGWAGVTHDQSVSHSKNIVKVFPIHKIVPAGVQHAADGMRVVTRGKLDEDAPEDLSVSFWGTP